jgi:hypothetical protein
MVNPLQHVRNEFAPLVYDQALCRQCLICLKKLSARHTRVGSAGYWNCGGLSTTRATCALGQSMTAATSFLKPQACCPSSSPTMQFGISAMSTSRVRPQVCRSGGTQRSSAHVAWRGCLYFVNDKVSTPLLLQTWRGDQWWNTLLSADQQVRMTTVIDLHAAETRQHDPLIMTQTGRADFLESHNSFAALISFWRQWQSQPRRDLNEQDRETIDTLTNGRFVLVVREPHLPRELSVEWLGNGFPDHISTAFQKTLHRSVCNLPDYRYGQAVAQAFERALRSPDAPLYEHVDAQVRYRPFERERRVYQRLILRFASPGAEDFLIAASVPSNPQERCVAC